MVRAVVGANWGDEGKGKITDMLGQESDIIVRFQGVPTQVTQLSMTMVNLLYIHFHQECSTVTQQVSLEMVLHLTSLFFSRR